MADENGFDELDEPLMTKQIPEEQLGFGISGGEEEVPPGGTIDSEIPLLEERTSPAEEMFNSFLDQHPDADPDEVGRLSFEAIGKGTTIEDLQPKTELEEETPPTEGTVLSELGKAVVRGGLNVSLTSLRALRAIDRVFGDIDKKDEFGGTLLGGSIQDVEAIIKSERFKPRREKGVTATFGKVVESLIPSVVFSIAGGGIGGAAAKGIAGTKLGLKALARTTFAKRIGEATGFVLGGSAPFGLAEFDSASEEIEGQISNNPDLTDEDKARLSSVKNSVAAKSAFAEAGFEGLSRVIELATGGIFKVVKPNIANLAKLPLNEIIKSGIPPAAGRAVIGAVSEAGTEAATALTQVAVREAEKIPTIGKKEAVIEGLVVGGLSGLIFNTGLQSVSALNRNRIKQAIQDEKTDPVIRKQAVHEVADLLREENINDGLTVQLIGNLQQQLIGQIDNNEPIKLDVTVGDIASEEGEREFRELQVQEGLRGVVDDLIKGEIDVAQVEEQAPQILSEFPETGKRLQGIIDLFKSDEIQSELKVDQQRIVEAERRADVERQTEEMEQIAFNVLTEEEQASIAPLTQLTGAEKRTIREAEALGLAKKIAIQKQKALGEKILNRNAQRFLAIEKEIADVGKEIPVAEEIPVTEEVAVQEGKVTEAEREFSAGEVITKEEVVAPTAAPPPTKELTAAIPTEDQLAVLEIPELKTTAESLGLSTKGGKDVLVRRISKLGKASQTLSGLTKEALGEKSSTEARRLAKDLNLQSTGAIELVRENLNKKLDSLTEEVSPGVPKEVPIEISPEVSPGGPKEVSPEAPELTFQQQFLLEDDIDTLNEKSSEDLRSQARGLGLTDSGERQEIIQRLLDEGDNIEAQVREGQVSPGIGEPLPAQIFEAPDEFGDLTTEEIADLGDFEKEFEVERVKVLELEKELKLEPRTKTVSETETTVNGEPAKEIAFGSSPAKNKGLTDSELIKIQKGEEIAPEPPVKPKPKRKATTIEENISEVIEECE